MAAGRPETGGREFTIPATRDLAVIIKALIIFRMVAVSFFLGTVIIFQMEFGSLLFPLPISMLIAATYLLSILYLFLVNRVKRYSAFMYVQLSIDLLVETGIIYYTGGFKSPFTFLYMLTIVSSVVTMQPGSSYFLSSGASILFGLLSALEYYRVIIPRPLLLAVIETIPSQGYVFFTVLVHMAAFYLVAFLSDFLLRRLRHTLLALMVKSHDLTYLQAFHQNVVANMGSGFLAVDMDRRIVSANRASEQILERRMDTFLRRNFDEIFPSLAAENALSGEIGSQKTQWSYLTETGKRKLLAVSSSPFRNSSGQVLGMIIIFQDITQFKLMEDAVAKSERMAAVGRMAAGLAHEIRNPLGSISGSIQMLKSLSESHLPQPHDKLMAIILRETDRLNGIIGRFLSYAHPSTKKTPNIDFSTLISDSAFLFSNDARYANIVEPELDLDPRIRGECDPESMKQVFWNLMLNAAQAMPNGGKIRISLKPVPGANGIAKECIMQFSDTGCGISEEVLARIFEPFYTTKEEGTGLGLPLVAKIVESHNGTISIKSKVGEGTVVIIHLPIIPIDISDTGPDRTKEENKERSEKYPYQNMDGSKKPS